MTRRKVKFEVEFTGFKMSFEGDEITAQEVTNRMAVGLAGMAAMPEMLMEGANHGAKALSPGFGATPPAPSAASTEQAPKVAKARKARTGKSPQGLIEALIDAGYLNEPRSADDICGELTKKGHTFAPSQLSTPLVRLTQKEYIVRDKPDEKGPYLYVKNPAGKPPEK